MTMSGELSCKSSETSLRRYLDSSFKGVDSTCNRLQDLVSTNNHKNDKLNELSQIESKKIENDFDDEDDEDDDGDGDGDDYDDVENTENDENGDDEIDDDWFSKLAGNKEFVRRDGTDGKSSLIFYGLNCGETPLLHDEDLDFKEKTMKTLRVGIRKIWRRGSATITAEDPSYKVAYLGNVLTGWAKGEGCIDKPLNTLWKNYNSSTKPDVQMKISVTQSGLKAVTKDHGLIEYWSHRITYCAVPSGLPRIFCWVYRHEGRKLKQELRCHAVLCPKKSVASRMAATLKLRLAQALLEFKRDKLLRQNARLSLANSVYENPSLPKRKILLSTGYHNYKPPLERSKSAPKLMSIEESLEEEESTPKAKRKLNGSESEEQELEEVEEEYHKKSNSGEKCEYKLANLNFVKKLCSSIENLVESTSNYSKKFLAERKCSKDTCTMLNTPEESLLKNNQTGDEMGDSFKKLKARKSVSFEKNRSEGRDLVKCAEYKKLEDGGEGTEPKPGVEILLEVRDQESDEGSSSLKSISSCCSDGSSLLTNSSDKSVEASFRFDVDTPPDCLISCEASVERLHAYLIDYNDPLLEDATKVILHPTGEKVPEKGCNFEEEGENSLEEDVTSDEGGYIEPTESFNKRLSTYSKEKDLPYHKIIRSTMLRPGRTKSSCLQV